MDSDSSDDDVMSFLGSSILARMSLPKLHSRQARMRRLPSDSVLWSPTNSDMLEEIVSVLTGGSSTAAGELLLDGADDCEVGGVDDTSTPLSLFELSCRVTGKHCSCATLEKQRPPLDETILQRVAFWAFPQDIYVVRAYANMTENAVNWRRALSLINDDNISDMTQVGFMATATIKPNRQLGTEAGREIHVSLVFERQNIMTSSCSECPTHVWCEHIIAAILYRIKHANNIRIHAPMTEVLSTLDREQLQKLLQYAVQRDPAGILGKVFQHLDSLRDSTSDMSVTAGAPDPTFGDLQTETTQWQLSVQQLQHRLNSDLDSMLRVPVFGDYSFRRAHEYYPDSYDVTAKMQSKLFACVSPVLELARQHQLMSAARVMTLVATTIANRLGSLPTPANDGPHINLSRLFHDVCHIYSLLLLVTDDVAARNLLVTTAEQLHREHGTIEIVVNKTSEWAELPSLCCLYPDQVTRMSESCGNVMLEPLVARQLSPYPSDLAKLLADTGPFDATSYSEDLVTMIARLQTVFYFDGDQSHHKITRLAFMVLHQLAILAQQDSVIGVYMAPSTTMSSSPADNSTPFSSSLLKALQSVGKPAMTPAMSPAMTPVTTPALTPTSAATLASSSTFGNSTTTSAVSDNVTPNVTPASSGARTRASGRRQTQQHAASSYDSATPGGLGVVVGKGKASQTATRSGVGVLVGKGKSARMHMQTSCKLKEPAAKRAKRSPASELVTSAQLSKGQIAHAMLYTLRLLIGAQKTATTLDGSDRKLLAGFCLQALEMSRHRLYASVEPASQSEQDWLVRLEQCVCDYLVSPGVQPDTEDAVVAYVRAVRNVGVRFYGGAYPLVLLDTVCSLCVQNDRLKAGPQGRDLVQICADVLLSLPACLEKVALPYFKTPASWQVLVDGGKYANTRKLREFAVKKIHCVATTFLSLVGSESDHEMELLSRVLTSLHNYESSSGSAAWLQVHLLKLISRDLRLQVWRFHDDPAVLDAMLWLAVHTYRESCNSRDEETVIKVVPWKDVSLSIGGGGGSKPSSENIEREFIFSLAHKLGIASLRIFADCWQTMLSCRDLQQLILTVAPPCDGRTQLQPELVDMIDRYYSADMVHDEDSCRLLTEYFKPTDHQYPILVAKILDNSHNYHSSALFTLAKLQADQRPARRKDTMDSELFAIVGKAMKNVAAGSLSGKVLESVDWMFAMSTSNRRDPARSPFYAKMIGLVCEYGGRTHPDLLLRVLQRMETHCGGSLMKHSSAADLGVALVAGYREHFIGRFGECGHAAYASVIADMQRARLECKHYVRNGGARFDSEVVELIRRMHCTKKKLIKLLSVDFPELLSTSTAASASATAATL